MKAQKIFCSGCDREVNIVLTAEPVHDGQANVPSPELVCLEIGDRCTGSLCPMFALPPEAMKARLARSGFDTGGLRHLMAHCDACDQVTDMVVLNREYCHCMECHATNHWRVADSTPLSA